MRPAPQPSAAESRDNAAFDALLWALSRPGLARMLPTPGEEAIVAALLDRECRAFAADPELTKLIARTGAELTDVARADHVFLGALTSCAPLAEVAVGSDLYPDDGATVILRATLDAGDPVVLSGPGIDGTVTLRVAGLPDGLWAARAARLRYPMGFDLFILDGDHVVGVPRSTTVNPQEGR